MHKYIKFIGDYSKLKSLGYEFQRLFANNYMQWCNNNTRVWKKGAEVTHGRLTNFEGPFFELYTSSETPPFDDRECLRVVLNREDHSVSYDYENYIRESRARMDDPENESLYMLECVYLKKKNLAALDKLIDLGWVELGEIK